MGLNVHISGHGATQLLLAGTSVSLGCRVTVVVLCFLMPRLKGLSVGLVLVQLSHMATCLRLLKGENIHGLIPEISSNSRQRVAAPEMI